MSRPGRELGIEPELEPQARPEPQPALPDVGDALTAAAAELRRKHGPDGFTVVVERPFIVLGDEDASRVRQRSKQTVAWAVERLKHAYFSADPSEQITIWLFNGERSYRHWARKLFGDNPDTPYGYYTAEHQALVMNIATGGGTLVHEIVHPFMEANFPACPSWFDEGLASLYEQCGDDDGKIVGYTNWRLAGLQEAIEARAVPTFEALTHTTRDEFYELDPGTNYAQARYLCYYLQEHGLLQPYYRAFVRNAGEDPSGYETLKQTLGREDMNAFKREWEQFTLALRYG